VLGFWARGCTTVNGEGRVNKSMVESRGSDFLSLLYLRYSVTFSFMFVITSQNFILFRYIFPKHSQDDTVLVPSI